MDAEEREYLAEEIVRLTESLSIAGCFAEEFSRHCKTIKDILDSVDRKEFLMKVQAVFSERGLAAEFIFIDFNNGFIQETVETLNDVIGELTIASRM